MNSENSKISRRIFLDTCLVAVPVAAALTGCTTAGDSKGSTSGASVDFVAKQPSKFRILQLTDLHYIGKRPEVSAEKTNALIHELLEKTKPDLVMITGDLWADNKDGAGEKGMRYAIPQFESWGVPWAYAWGNHDKLSDYSVGHKAFGEAKNSLYRGAEGNGNYAIDVITSKHKRLLQLVCLNTKNDGADDETRAWLGALAEKDKEPVPRLAFFHIPLKQYAAVWDEGKASGVKGEAVASEQENGTTLSLLSGLGVKACFCGHDHVNDYSGIADGVELVYGRAAGGYGASRLERGGKIIDFNGRTGAYSWYSVTRKEVHWQPEPAQRIDLK